MSDLDDIFDLVGRVFSGQGIHALLVGGARRERTWLYPRNSRRGLYDRFESGGKGKKSDICFQGCGK